MISAFFVTEFVTGFVKTQKYLKTNKVIKKYMSVGMWLYNTD